ncbi:Gem-associated protein 2 [Frankliniella fusca]|uniref:Gem-associated protein 2 n=1 Tax=Frankliniella fusca TaxID=407009 RepID=A0AAE1LGQ4_9NEOP|nr:Gem-associated protein 2 [Frankliniella fusca]
MDSDDSDYCAPATAFPIDTLKGRDVDLNVPPANGMEYLQRVMLEAKQCEQIVTVHPQISTNKPIQPQIIEEVKTMSPLAPSSEWQERKVSDFSNLRQKIVKWKASRHPAPTIELPSISDKKGWRQLCFGAQCDKETSDDNSCGSPPLLSILVNIGQPMVDTLLNWHSQWLEECNHITHRHGQWIFALLSCLELPLHPDTCSTLRHIARLCQQLRSSMIEPEASQLAAVNLLICLVGRYFCQTDLVD